MRLENFQMYQEFYKNINNPLISSERKKDEERFIEKNVYAAAVDKLSNEEIITQLSKKIVFFQDLLQHSQTSNSDFDNEQAQADRRNQIMDSINLLERGLLDIEMGRNILKQNWEIIHVGNMRLQYNSYEANLFETRQVALKAFGIQSVEYIDGVPTYRRGGMAQPSFDHEFSLCLSKVRNIKFDESKYEFSGEQQLNAAKAKLSRYELALRIAKDKQALFLELERKAQESKRLEIATLKSELEKAKNTKPTMFNRKPHTEAIEELQLKVERLESESVDLGPDKRKLEQEFLTELNTVEITNISSFLNSHEIQKQIDFVQQQIISIEKSATLEISQLTDKKRNDLILAYNSLKKDEYIRDFMVARNITENDIASGVIKISDVAEMYTRYLNDCAAILNAEANVARQFPLINIVGWYHYEIPNFSQLDLSQDECRAIVEFGKISLIKKDNALPTGIIEARSIPIGDSHVAENVSTVDQNINASTIDRQAEIPSPEKEISEQSQQPQIESRYNEVATIVDNITFQTTSLIEKFQSLQNDIQNFPNSNGLMSSQIRELQIRISEALIQSGVAINNIGGLQKPTVDSQQRVFEQSKTINSSAQEYIPRHGKMTTQPAIDYDFTHLESIYNNYGSKIIDGESIVYNKQTNKPVIDDLTIMQARFAEKWVDANSLKRLPSHFGREQLAFNEPARETYERMMQIIKSQLELDGKINAKEMSNLIEKLGYQYSKTIIDSLFSSPATAELVESWGKQAVASLSDVEIACNETVNSFQ